MNGISYVARPLEDELPEPVLMERGRQARTDGDRRAALSFFLRAVASSNIPAHIPPRLEAATELRELGRLAEAEALYAEIHARDPGHLWAWMGLGHCARRRGDRAAALDCFQKARGANKTPTQFAPHLECATELRELGRIAEAEQLYAEIHAVDPGHIWAWMGLGHSARRRGDRAAALGCFQKARDANKTPTQFAPDLEAATELRELGRVAEAERLYGDVHAQAPAHVAALMGLGQCARRRGDRAAAIAAFEKAMAASAPAKNFGPHQAMAAELRMQGRITEAEDLYREILAQLPDSASALVGLGGCARHLGQHEAALGYFEQAAAQAAAADKAPALESIRELCLLGRFDEAERRAQALHDSDPGNPAFIISLGQVARAAGRNLAALQRFCSAEAIAATAGPPSALLSAGLEIINELRGFGRPAEAAARCKTLLTANPTNPHVMAALGHCHRQLGRRDEAWLAFQAAIRLDPLNLNLQLQIVAEQRDRGETLHALRLLEDMGLANPHDPQVFVERARVYRQQDRLDEALAELRCAIALSPLRADSRLELADTLRALGRPEEARDHVEQVLAALPHQPRAMEILADLARAGMDYDTAESLLRRSVALTPERPGAQLSLARLLQQLGRLDEAMACVEAATAAFGKAPDIMVQHVVILIEMGRWETALAMAREASASAPWHMGLWEQWCRLACLHEDRAVIETCFAKTPAQTQRERAQLAFFRGIDAGSLWRLEEAIAWQKEALTLNPQHGAALQELGRLSLLTLDIETTRRCLQSSARLSASMNRLQGRSPNISQTHLGQLVDEFRIDTALLEALRPILREPPALRVAGLLRLQRRHPESTAVAVMLLIALRQADSHPPPNAEAPARIPRRIVQFWDSAEPPEDLAPLRDSWRTMNPGYSYELFNERTAGQFLLRFCGIDVFAAFMRAREPAQKADLFRLGFLAVNGGVYVDCDDRCLTPLDRWLPRGASMVAYQEDFGTLGNNFLAASTRAPVILRALQNATAAVNRGDADVLWLSTGPGALSRAFAQVMAERVEAPLAMLEEVALLDRGALLQVSHIHARAGYKVTARHWMHTALGRSHVAVTRAFVPVD
jgi:tetratricopeptide (TPR) repeat protein